LNLQYGYDRCIYDKIVVENLEKKIIKIEIKLFFTQISI